MSISPLTLPSSLPYTDGASPAAAEGQFWGSDGLSFEDVLDVVNPLQQLPGVSTIYREATDSTISTGARLLGGALLGGPLGFLAALVNTIAEQATGDDIGSNIYAMLVGDSPQEGVSATETTETTETSENAGYNMASYIPSNQRAAHNAYVQAQSLLA